VLFEWDGLSSEANYGYEVDGDKIYSVTKYKSGVALTTSRGEVLYCQGGLQNLAYFPIYFTDENWSNVFIETLSIRNPISHRGMLSDGNNIYFTLNAKNINIADDRNRPQWTNIMPSGVWCYNPKVGLTTKHTIGSGTVSRTNAITTGNVDTSTDVITIAGATAPVTGTPCFYNAGSVGNGTVIGGLKTGWRYFIIKVTDSTIKLATTKENAENGTAINLTGTGNNDQYITCHPNISFGGITNSATCLFKNGLLGVAGRAYTNRILVGGHIQVGTDTSLARASLHGIVSYQENRGYYISPKIMSSEVTDNMVNMIVKHKLLKNPEDKFIVKYRNVERVMPSYITANDSAITWTATDTFTSTNDLSDVLVGDEVEITSGAGAGYLAHVTSIEESSGTYTVEIDETIENISVNDRAFAVFDNWTKIKTVTSADATNHFEAPVAKQSTWTQFKIDIRGIDTTIEEIIFNNQVFTPVV
jgi:transcription antitermination factor NusG